jgi:hypothetical protein
MANGAPYGDALAGMLALLDDFVPASPAPLPAAGISVASLAERSVGLGGLRGLEFRNRFEVGELKAIRLEALVRYDLWGDSPGSAAQAAAGVSAGLLGARDDLAAHGVLKLNLESLEEADFAASLNAWRTAALYRVLYEFPYQDAGGSESLIARIPVELEPEEAGAAAPEETVVTDELARWDDLAAPALVVRGPFGVGALDVLAWIAAQAPTQPVSITRTFTDAPGLPQAFAALDAFLDAIAGPTPATRHAVLAFPALPDFLAAIGPAGPPTALGDWDQDGAADLYIPRTRAVLPPVLLPEPEDRLEITYGGAALDRPAVVYLRATRG